MKTSYLIDLKSKGNSDIGILVPLEYRTNIPFEINRIFYTYNVPSDASRGSHAYINTKQVLICLSGNLKVKCFDGNTETIYILDNPSQGLYIDAKVWRTTLENSSDAILLVLSSLEYNEEDYIRDYDNFLEVIKCI